MVKKLKHIKRQIIKKIEQAKKVLNTHKKIALPSIAAVLVLSLVSNAMMASGESSDEDSKIKAVKLIGPKGGSCSGEQVRAPSGIDYILTAAHCKVLAKDNNIIVITEDGHRLQRRIIEEDINSDLLLLEGLPNLEGLKIAKTYHRGQHVRTFTHGRGLDTYKTEGNLIQMSTIDIIIGIMSDELDCTMPKFRQVAVDTFFGRVDVCALHVEEVVTTAGIVPGSSGGMIVNDRGELVGVASASDGVFGYLVKLTDIQKFIAGY